MIKRLREILGNQPLGQVELLLAAEGIALASWMLASGGDCAFKLFTQEIQDVLPVFKHGRLAMWAFIGANLVRLWAVAQDRVMWRCWIARIQTFGWMMVLLAYGIAGVGANELPLYFVGFLANFWLSVRLDVRSINERTDARSAGQ